MPSVSQDCPGPPWHTAELRVSESLELGPLVLLRNCCVTLPKWFHHSEPFFGWFGGGGELMPSTEQPTVKALIIIMYMSDF